MIAAAPLGPLDGVIVDVGWHKATLEGDSSVRLTCGGGVEFGD